MRDETNEQQGEISSPSQCDNISYILMNSPSHLSLFSTQVKEKQLGKD